MTLNHIKRVKIVGAGSIGNHLAHAARTFDCDVVVCDTSDVALRRMREQIYPARYGAWDSKIDLRLANEAPIGAFDLICIGTPPDTHLPLALQALGESPRALQIEKPLCPPDLQGASQLVQSADQSSTTVFVGYDHLVGKATRRLEEFLIERAIGQILTFDVEFREFWGGIFQAHPWLNGPEDSYLGFWKRGGGASGEHSHALNLWQHLSHVLGFGRVEDVTAMVRYVRQGSALYDDCCFWHLRAESGMIGRVVQDVVTQPVRKVAFVQGDAGTLQWINGYRPGVDAVILSRVGREPEVVEVPKTRPEDFIDELRHIDASLGAGAPHSPLSLKRGLETMLVVAAAHKSQEAGCRVRVKYINGLGLEALE
jgi:predicted dehydrogenase